MGTDLSGDAHAGEVLEVVEQAGCLDRRRLPQGFEVCLEAVQVLRPVIFSEFTHRR